MREGWTTALLGDLVTVCRRGRAPEYEGGVTPVVGQKCVRDGGVDLGVARVTNEDAKPLPDWVILQSGDILVNSTGTGTVGRVGWLRGERPPRVTADSHVAIIRPDAECVEPEYLGYYLHEREDQLGNLAEGSTNQVELAPDSLKQLEVWLPPRDEQRRIVDLLSSVESVIQAALSRARAAETLKESLLAGLLTGEHVVPPEYDGTAEPATVALGRED